MAPPQMCEPLDNNRTDRLCVRRHDRRGCWGGLQVVQQPDRIVRRDMSNGRVVKINNRELGLKQSGLRKTRCNSLTWITWLQLLIESLRRCSNR